ncbi:MAG: Nif3-like dinuclear metal center hexameric protein [Bacilli bacterium]|nr:Nif3-like dinuclear metal center hexameric protein [Bacilli bacterium]
MKVKEIVDYLLAKYPLELASSFDLGKVGLQFGSMSKEVKKVMIALDGTSAVVDEAIEEKCDLLLCHHPFLFSPIINMDYNSPLGKKMLKVFKNELNIFAMHTNFDCAINGMNDHLANLLGLKNVYSVPEVPTSESYMRIGEIDKCSLAEFAYFVKETFNEEGIRVVGDLDKQIKKVAILGGSGGSYAVAAKKLGCDCIITGEVKQNNAIDAVEYNMGIIEVSHSVEALFKEHIKNILSEEFKDIEFILSKKDVNPFKCL